MRNSADRTPRAWATALCVLGVELRRLARDRRALASAILLPALLYPVLFGLHSRLGSISTESRDSALVRVVADLDSAAPELARAVARALEAEIPIRVVSADVAGVTVMADELARLADVVREGDLRAIEEERAITGRLFDHGYDALVSALPDPVLAGRSVLRVHHDASDELSAEARVRIERALDRVEAEHRTQTLVAAFGRDPAAHFVHEAVNVATERAANDAILARLLPLLAVLVLVAGGSYAALSTFAGEREGGTLETLLVQPVPAISIAWGKFLAVLALAFAALLSNVGSVLASLALGLGTLPGMVVGEGSSVLPAMPRLVVSAIVFLPTALLVCALLALNSARARSFREGQQVLLPLSILLLVPAGVAGATSLELDALTALVPLLGASLGVRDAVRGVLEPGPGLLMALASCAWAALVLRHLARTLDAERILQSAGNDDELAWRHVQSRTALRHGVLAVAATYVIGGWLQSRAPIGGLVATLWLLFPVLTLFAVRPVARRAGESLRRALWLHLPTARQALGAALLAPAVTLATRSLMELQEQWAPLPSSFARAAEASFGLDELSPFALVFVFALSPGICEELLFRGALLSGMRRDLPAWRIVLWQAALFGAVHASIYRLVPTALVGGLLAALVLRTRCLLPAMILHVTYDALLVGSTRAEWLLDPGLAWLALPGALLLAARPAEDEAPSPGVVAPAS